MPALNELFGKIFIVTNQQGIGKKLMTHDNLREVHAYMIEKITQAGGNIDKIYYCPFLESEKSIYRKPNTGMLIQAQNDFQSIDMQKAIMVGDSTSDLQLARNGGLLSVYINDNLDLLTKNHALYDFHFKSLEAFKNSLFPDRNK